MTNTELRNIALFIDFENFGDHDTFDPRKLIDKLKERGRLIIKRAYADWGRFNRVKRQMLENSVDLIEMPSRTMGKNAADIKLVVDALETAITKAYIDTIVVVSGDSDYTPLISKLREYNKYVIVIGGRQQTSRLLIGYCDELIYYSNLVGDRTVQAGNIHTAFDLLMRAMARLEDQGIEIRSSQLKPYMKQLDATFDESNYGFSQFKRFLEQAVQENLIEIEDIDHGNLLVRQTSDSSAAARSQVVAPASAGQTTVQLPEETHDPRLLHLIYWAFKINEQDGTEGVMMGNLVQTIKLHLAADFEVATYGYPKGKGFKGIAEDLQNYGYVRLAYDAEKNQYILFLEPSLAAYGQKTQPPKHYTQLRLESFCARQGLTINIPHIKLFAAEAQRLHTLAAEDGRLLTAQELFDETWQALQEQGTRLPYKRVANTILASRAILAADGRPVVEMEDQRPLAAFPAAGPVVQACAALLKRVIESDRG